jgi:hypothetical protein
MLAVESIWNDRADETKPRLIGDVFIGVCACPCQLQRSLARKSGFPLAYFGKPQALQDRTNAIGHCTCMTSRKKKQWPQRGHFQRRATVVTAIQSAA